MFLAPHLIHCVPLFRCTYIRAWNFLLVDRLLFIFFKAKQYWVRTIFYLSNLGGYGIAAANYIIKTVSLEKQNIPLETKIDWGVELCFNLLWMHHNGIIDLKKFEVSVATENLLREMKCSSFYFLFNLHHKKKMVQPVFLQSKMGLQTGVGL